MTCTELLASVHADLQGQLAPLLEEVRQLQILRASLGKQLAPIREDLRWLRAELCRPALAPGEGCVSIPIGTDIHTAQRMVIISTVESLGNQSEAARVLGCSRRKVYSVIRKTGPLGARLALAESRERP